MYVSAGEPMGLYIDVFLDGVRVDVCKEAHEDEGWIRACVRDEAGRFRIDAAGHRIHTEIRHGVVRLRMRESAPLWACEQYVQRRTAMGCIRK